MMDLDVPTPARPDPRQPRTLAVAALVLSALALAFVLAVQLPRGGPTAAPATSGAVPLLTLDADAPEATATVWFADGTHASAAQAFRHDWRPDRPIRMVTVASPGSCSIQVDQRMVMQDTVGPGQIAVCVWLAPADR